ncbi:Glycosyltransferase involved in cell wall bisynthesis [Pustulibacterium marinum]|uniref:Glycosyltransferase involved in cell wall bisynthesis n=1 Tax=Pustulibacterium marinum TaxID=1224947 RepID=A0A1I7FW00_9FLAO|nr:glycosyltransferase [Pustulibacterium marinum]SFU40375.1 Glycosyltransferase involved in cell wall bisynthesis [Pustulibacterium marinum]
MKILLLGEYSGFFNSLKFGLTQLGHDVTLAGRKDGFKNFPVDISFEPVFLEKKAIKFFRKIYHRFFHSDVTSLEIFYIFWKQRAKFKDFDIVFLINEQSLTYNYYTEKKILKFLFQHNKKVFLSACSDDVIYIDFLLNNGVPHHVLSEYVKDKSLFKHFQYSLHYTKNSSKRLHEFIFENIEAVIPGDYDYVLAYENHPKTTSLIPFPVRLHLLAYKPLVIEDKIIIFHGINKVNYYKKGNGYFEKALEIIQKKYADKIEIITAVSLPYEEYIEKYNRCHILLDQAFAYDQGYNALEAMAKGKVVFTGACEDWKNHYKVEEDSIVINAIPDADYMASKLEWLILHPEKIVEISKNARAFIEKEHDAVNSAEQYLYIWEQFSGKE